MKNFKEIQKLAKKSDYSRIAEIVGMSPSTVRMVVKGQRSDLHDIRRNFSQILEQREKLSTQAAKRRARQQNKLAA